MLTPKDPRLDTQQPRQGVLRVDGQQQHPLARAANGALMLAALVVSPTPPLGFAINVTMRPSFGLL